MARKSELEQFLNESSRYLKLDFDLEKPDSSINFCSEHEWEHLRKKGVIGPAFYHPKEEKVYLSPDASQADMAHEYFGHALYSEKTMLGKKFKHNLELVSSLEERYGIPTGMNLNLIPSDKFEVKKLKENEYNIFYNTNNPEIQEYIQLKKETQTFFDRIRPLQEGFSFWMEEKILKQIGPVNLWRNRYENLTKSPYHNFYNSFLKEESEKGPITLFYKLGFPKSKNKEIIKKVAKENLKNFDKLEYLIQYGSLERDIDLLAVYPNSVVSKNGLVYDGCTDINVLNETSFLQKLKLYDIEILEPLLTGNLLIGDKEEFEKLKSGIKKNKPSKEAVEYANKRSLETFNSAMLFYHQNKYKCDNSLLKSNNSKEAAKTILGKEQSNFCTEDMLYTLNNLSFSLSYKLSADYYNKEKSFTTFKNLIKNPLLKNVMAYLKDVENGKETLKEGKTLGLITQTKDFLLEGFTP